MKFSVTRWRVPLGFVLALIYVYRAHPLPLTLAIGLPIAACGLALRAWAAGYIRKNDVLATDGPYRFTRNPLYLGSTLLAVGFVVAAADWIMAVLVTAMMLGIYLPVIRREEAFLRSRFGADFDAYVRRVPRLLPRWPRQSRAGSSPTFSPALYLRHREYNALLGFLFVVAILTARLLGALPWR